MKQEELIENFWFLRYPIECNDGWLPLIKYMCEEIRDVIKLKYHDFRTCEEPFEFSQIKEKYGRLVCYTSFCNYEILDIIDKYEEESCNVCEVCGMKGELRGDLPWILTLCNRCYSKRLKELRIKGVDV